jgi:hypothetical protein
MKNGLSFLLACLISGLWANSLHGQGETCATATVISSLPFSGTGNTCLALDDYNEECPFTTTGGQDLVFAFSPTGNISVDINLCTGITEFDTKLIVYENVCPPPGTGTTGTQFGCNDDACDNPPFFSNPWVSGLFNLNLTGGNTYYIIVDAYDGFACGNFTLTVDTASGMGGLLTRNEAVNILLDPVLSGLGFDLEVQSIWSPFFDFGSGPGFEGLLPPFSFVEPAEFGYAPFPGSGVFGENPSYFFWVDNFPFAEFAHSTLFVMMDASMPDPSIFNGGIQVTDEGWWPNVFPGGTSGQMEFFATEQETVTDNPAGSGNPEGHIGGPAMTTADLHVTATETPVAPTAPKSWGLVVLGSSDQHHINNRTKMVNNLRNHYGVDSANIIQANNGNPATKQQVCDAIDSLAKKVDNKCDKIYIRLTSHGTRGNFLLPGADLTAQELCQKLQPIAAKGVPICMVINACFSGTLLDANNWNFPAGSVIITSANDTTSYGRNDYRDGTTPFNESLFVYAFTKCLRDTTDSNMDGKYDADTNMDGIVGDDEAFRWMIANRLCVFWRAGDTSMLYPNGGQRYWDPMPRMREVGRNPRSLNINVKNLSGATKTDFHIIFKGDVRGGVPLAWKSDSLDHLGDRWATMPGERTVTYDSAQNQTMVCWEDPDDGIPAGNFVHFGYYISSGNLRPVRQYWTPTPAIPATPDRTPTAESSTRLIPDGSGIDVGIITRSVEGGGDGVPLQADIYFRASPIPIELNQLSLSSPQVTGLLPIPLGNVILEPDVMQHFQIDIPTGIQTDQFLVLETHLSWGLNTAQATSLAFFDPFGNVDALPCGKDVFEPNDELSEAASLFAGGFGTFGQARICKLGDIDYWRFDLPPNSNRDYRARLINPPIDLDLELLDAGGMLMGSSMNPGDETETLMISKSLPAGPYYLRVSGKNAAWSPDPYNLVIDQIKVNPLVVSIKPNVKDPIFRKTEALADQPVLSLIPNPASEEVFLLIQSPAAGLFRVRIFDLNGNLAFHRFLSLGEGNNQIRQELNGLRSGIYLVELQIGKQKYSQKLEVLR